MVFADAAAWSVFKRKPAPDWIRGGHRFASRKRVKTRIKSSVLISIRAEKALAARIENPSDRRHERGAERILDQGRRDERRNADQPRLFDAKFHAERKPAKSGGENENVSERHRDEQPKHRSVPAALAQPSRYEGRRHEAEEISGRRADQRRKAADRTCEYRKSDRSFGEIGDQRCAAEP